MQQTFQAGQRPRKSIGPAARKCKGKKQAAFRACVRREMKR
ncbi:MAG: hypothetical protein WD533_06440 [Dehalococcoidia bacterium]